MLFAVGSGACMRPEVELEGNGRKVLSMVEMSSLLRVACFRAEACDCNPRTRPCSAPSPLLSDASFSWARRGGCLAANSSSFFLTHGTLYFLAQKFSELSSTLLNKWLTRARNLYEFFSLRYSYSLLCLTHTANFFSSFLFFPTLYFFFLLSRSLSLSLLRLSINFLEQNSCTNSHNRTMNWTTLGRLWLELAITRTWSIESGRFNTAIRNEVTNECKMGDGLFRSESDSSWSCLLAMQANIRLYGKVSGLAVRWRCDREAREFEYLFRLQS